MEIGVKSAVAEIESTTDLLERALKLSGLVTTMFQLRGFPLVVVGGSAVEFYTEGGYMSGDIDFCRRSIRAIPPRVMEEFLAPLGISQTRLALDLHVPAPRINAIVRGKRAITADTALRLGQYFKMEPQFWLNLQSNYDLGVASGGVWAKIKKLIPEFVPERAVAVL